jgi:hypothetical protein
MVTSSISPKEDLWNLAERDTTRVTGDIFQVAWNYELEKRKHPSLWIALFRGFSGPYFWSLNVSSSTRLRLGWFDISEWRLLEISFSLAKHSHTYFKLVGALS